MPLFHYRPFVFHYRASLHAVQASSLQFILVCFMYLLVTPDFGHHLTDVPFKRLFERLCSNDQRYLIKKLLLIFLQK